MGLGDRDRKTAFRGSRAVVVALCFLLASLCPCFVQNAFAEDLELLNRPVNASGLTGLIYTTSPFVLPRNTFEIGAFARSENSLLPSYSLNEYSLSLSAGIGGSMEISLRSSYYTYKIEPSTEKSRNLDDLDVAFKWNFLSSREGGDLQPAVSLIVAGVVPAKHRDLVTTSVDHWAARIGLSAGSELVWMDHVIGIYADAQVAAQDLSQVVTRDRYYLFNTGILFPISKNRNLQMLLEYNAVEAVDVLKVTGGDYQAITYGLRLVNERFNLSIGTQFLHKKEHGFMDSSRVIGLMSFKI